MRPKADARAARMQLNRIFAVMPNLRDVMQRENTVTSVVKMWTGVDLQDLDQAVQRILDGDARAYPEGGSWHECGYHVKQMVRGITQDRSVREEREAKRARLHEQATGDKLKSGTRLKMAMAASMAMGRLYRDGKISREENQHRVDELVEWDRGGRQPHWLDGALSTDISGE